MAGNSSAAAAMNISLLKMGSLPVTNHMVTLHKSGTPAEMTPAAEFKVTGLPSKINADNWVKAEEFVPGQKWRGLAGEFAAGLKCLKILLLFFLNFKVFFTCF